MSDVTHGVWIDGEERRGVDAPALAVEDPSTTEVFAHVPLSGPDTVDAAVRGARTAFDDGRWSDVAPSDQAAVLHRLADLVDEHAEELSALEARDNGKAIVEARGDVGGAAAVLRYYAGWPTKLHGTVNPTDRAFLAYTTREPVGVCGQVVPWNYPLLMASWKLGPALAAGNAVVLKPAEQTPLSALRLAALALEAGLPAGVLNVVTGDGTTGAALVAHPLVDKVAFTGSTEVGRRVMASAAETIKSVTLELGGKNPNVVFADADLGHAVERAVVGAFENGGQACIAGSRVLVERAVHDEVVARLAEQARALRVGPPLDEATDIGALVSREQLDRVLGYVRAGAEQGATVRAGGEDRPDLPGYFMRPTVMTATAENVVSREEVFGPVVAVTPFDGEEEAVALANGTAYGLAAAVWTKDLQRALRVARRLRAGTVWVNEYGKIRPEVPFGGMKQSGVGRELGAAGLDAYTEHKSVFVAL